MSAGDSSSSKSSSRSSASSTSRCALLSTASLLLPLSAVVLALLYTSLPIRWPLHTDSDATVSFVTETLSDSDLKAQMRPVQKGRHLPASSTSSLGTTFLDRLNQTRLNDVITLRFGSENNRSNEHFKRRFISLDELNRFISVQMLPRLKSIVSMDYFRYIKLNLNRKCALWPDDTRCSLKDCSIKTCDESQLPRYLKKGDEHDLLATHTKTDTEEAGPSDDKLCEQQQHLQSIDMTLPHGHVTTMNSIFECYVDEYEDGQYYDLQINPERFTGYGGHSSQRIWKSIYEENCFKSPRLHSLIEPILFKQPEPFVLRQSNESDLLSDFCFEEHFFYRAISGLHSSINLHLCSGYLFKNGTFGYNLDEFVRRFDGRDEYLRNLYFVFMLEWRALQKAESYLLSKVNWASSGDHLQTREAIRNLLQIGKRFGAYFDDEQLLEKQQFLSSEFATHFRNISSTIMDCVACDKCRLWGKVQIHALGTTFKILLADLSDIENGGTAAERFHLHRHEISTLINGITRLSTSIHNLEVFNRLMKNQPIPSNYATNPDFGNAMPSTPSYFKFP